MGDDSLVPTIPFSADIRQLEAQLNRAVNTLNKSMGAMEARAGAAERRLHSSLGRIGAGADPNFGASLDKIFDNSRLAMLDAGTSRLRVFGSALEPLGALGLAAATGAAAFFGAMAMAAKAAEWAEDLKRTAETIGETTDKIQEMDYAALASGVSIDAERSSLEALNGALGKVQDNLTRSKNMPLVRAFGDLGLSPEQLKSFNTAADLLPVLADRIRNLRTAAEQTAVAKLLGIEPLLPLLKQGGDAVRKYTQDARDMGAVVSGETVDQMAKLNDKMKEADQRFNTASNTIGSVFVPALLSIKNAAADAMTWVAKLLSSLPDGHNTGAWVQQMQNGFAAQARAAAVRSGDAGAIFGANGTIAEVVNPQSREAMARRLDAEAASAFAQAGQITKQRQADLAADREPPTTGNTPDSPPAAGSGHTHHAPMDHAPAEIGEATERFLEAAAKATQDLGAAHLERLALIQQKLQDAVEKARTQKGLQPAERDTLISAAMLTAGAETAGENEDFQRAREEHQRQIERADADIAEFGERYAQSLRDAADKLIEGQEQTLRSQDEELQAREQMARTRQERLALQLQMLANERQARDLEIDKKHLGAPQTAAALQASADTFAAQSAAARQGAGGPFSQFARENSFANAGDQMQAQALQFMDTLNDALAAALVDHKRINGQQLARGAAGDLVKTGLKDAEGSVLGMFGLHGKPDGSAGNPFHVVQAGGLGGALGSLLGGAGGSGGSGGVGGAVGAMAGGGAGGAGFLGLMLRALHIPGFAEGAGSAPGGLSIIGEKGPELMNVPRGASIMPNDMLRSLHGYASGVGDFSGLRRGPSHLHVSVANHYDMSGTSGDAAVDAKIHASEQRTQGSVFDAVRRAVPGMIAQNKAEYG